MEFGRAKWKQRSPLGINDGSGENLNEATKASDFGIIDFRGGHSPLASWRAMISAHCRGSVKLRKTRLPVV